jgi:hypothetical protein
MPSVLHLENHLKVCIVGQPSRPRTASKGVANHLPGYRCHHPEPIPRFDGPQRTTGGLKVWAELLYGGYKAQPFCHGLCEKTVHIGGIGRPEVAQLGPAHRRTARRAETPGAGGVGQEVGEGVGHGGLRIGPCC